MDTLRWQAGTLFLLDQTKLPFEEIYLPCHSWQDVRQAISVLAVRGAPAIGVAAAYAVVLAARTLCQKGGDTPFLTDLEAICRDLDAARPTAVNLHWALTQMMACARQHEADGAEAVTAVLEEKAIAIHEADVAINTAMARFGADELEKLGRPLTLLTHCNAGALATAGVGTALGVIRELHRRGRVSMVYADETRPLLQGARLTAFELMADHIPVTLITDNMAAWTLKTKDVDAIIVGADGSQIPIEERNHDEVRSFRGAAAALPETPVFNPAFDVTPHENIRAIVTEQGIIHRPDAISVPAFFQH